MFQVKFLKPVTLSRNKSLAISKNQRQNSSTPFYTFSSTVTISNDLGEQFYYGDAIIKVIAKIQPSSDTSLLHSNHREIIGMTSIRWNAGMRAASFDLDTSRRDTVVGHYVSLHISAQNTNDHMDFDDITTKALIRSTLDDSKPLFQNCKVTKFHKLSETRFYRSFSELIQIPNPNGLPVKTERRAIRPIGRDTQLYEELSGSIARHLWDAGIYLDEMPAESFLDFITIDGEKPLSTKDTLNILELGTGIGLVSIHLGKLFINSKILATDLEDAQEICERNIKLNDVKVKFSELDWESEISTDEKWDLIVVTDCTYNPLYYDVLINVLKTEYSGNTKVLLAHKFREPVSEVEFFEKMEGNGFALDNQLWVQTKDQSLLHIGLYRR